MLLTPSQYVQGTLYLEGMSQAVRFRSSVSFLTIYHRAY